MAMIREIRINDGVQALSNGLLDDSVIDAMLRVALLFNLLDF